MVARAADPTTPRPERRRSPLHGLFPPQHGAWAFLALPLVLGGSRAGGSWLLVPLAVAWVAAYPFSWAATGLLSAKRRQRFVRPAAAWGALVVPLALLLVVLRPWLVWVGLGYAALFAVNVRYARRHDERALANDLVLIAEACLMVPLVVAVVGGEQTWTPPWDAVDSAPVVALTVVCAMTLLGSTLHVKSLIRERRNPRFTRLSQAFSVLCVPGAAVAVLAGEGELVGSAGAGAVLLAVVFAAVAARTFLMPGRTWRPGRIGMIELACFVAVAVAALAALG